MEIKDDLVNRLEANAKLSWALRASILHRQGYTNTTGHWHPGPGVPAWKPKKKKP